MNYLNILTDHCFFSKLSKLVYLKTIFPSNQPKNQNKTIEELSSNYSLDPLATNYDPIINVRDHNYSNFAFSFLKGMNNEQSSLFDMVLSSGYSEIEQCQIPQFSNFNCGSNILVEILVNSGNFGPTFKQLGCYLLDSNRKNSALIKYGENHSKLAELLDLAFITPFSPRQVYLTELGYFVRESDQSMQEKILSFQIIKIPIIKKILIDRVPPSSYLDLLREYLAPSTSKRRLGNLRTLIDIISKSVGSI